MVSKFEMSLDLVLMWWLIGPRPFYIYLCDQLCEGKSMAEAHANALRDFQKGHLTSKTLQKIQFSTILEFLYSFTA